MKVLALILLVACAKAQVEISIDNLDDLRVVEGTAPSTCDGLMYSDEHADLCKSGTPNPGTSGFWSSCDNSRCEVSISLGKLGGLGKVPSLIHILSYIQGNDAEIQLRYRLIPGAVSIPFRDFDFVINTRWEISGPFNLSKLTDPVLSPESELVFRLSSAPFADAIDIIDKIIFTFSEPIESTEPTVEPPTSTPSTAPPTTQSTATTTTRPTTTEEPNTTTPSPTRPPVDFECPTEEGLYSDPKNCRGFYQCASWYPYHFCCPLPLFFNPAAQRCDFQDMVECHNDPGLPCDSPPGKFNLNSRDQ